MHKVRKYVLLFSISLILLLFVSSVSAFEDVSISDADIGDGSSIGVELADSDSLAFGMDEGLVEDDSVLCSGSSSLNTDEVLIGSGDNEYSDRALKDSNDAVNNTYYVDAGNFNDYFENNVLKSDYSNATIIFNGTFNDFGIIKFYSNNTKISSIDSTFYNTVFDLGASGIILYNVNMLLDREFENNEYAGIFVHADDVTVYNCTINYYAPENVTAFGIYSDGHRDDFIGLNIVNNTINLYGHGLGSDNYNYAILMRNTHDSVVYGNRIYCELPLKFVSYTFSGVYGDASKDSDAAFAGDHCENLTLSNNDIHTFINGGVEAYPTLDTVVLYGCTHSLIENNNIRCEDLFTQLGNDNYLYVLDLHSIYDVVVIGNNISAFTNGGKPGMGTAYPIQISGPANQMKIAFNNITTFNRGPNIGIYSNNWGGDTFIDIISNFINVTGDASTGETNPDWCLVSGIEVQDNGDNILNNTIIVNNLGGSISDYVYGISYVQSITGRHTYNIQFNNITTNGDLGVKILGNIKDSTTYNSTISNNVLNTGTTSDMAGAATNDQVGRPDGTVVLNNTNGRFKNNMSEDYYPDWLKDYVRCGSGTGTGDFAWMNRILNDLSNGTGFSDAVGNGTAPWGSGNASGSGHGSADGDYSGRGKNSESSSVNGNPNSNSSSGVLNGDLNSTSSAPGLSGSSLPSSSISSPSDAGSSAANPNAYEIDEKDNVLAKSSDYLQLALICVVALLLLGIGYKRQKDKEEEE